MANGRQMQRFIQMARRKLGMDDATYRDFLEDVTGSRTTKGMAAAKLWKVVQALERKGFKMESPKPTAAFLADDEQTSTMLHHWLKLKGYGILRDPSGKALDSYARRIAKPGRSQETITVKQAQLVIETLKKWVGRVEDGIIAQALQTGRLRLPGGYTEYRAFIAAVHSGSLDVSLTEEAARFWEAVDQYLASYRPERKAA